MASDRSVLERQFERVELRPFTVDGFHRRRKRKDRNRRIGSAVAALLVAGVAIGGLARTLTSGRGASPAEQPANSFAGNWVSTDVDGSFQTMTIRANPDGAYEMVLHDDMTGPCSGPSTDTGTGRLDRAGRLVILSITTTCESGGEPAGAGDHLIFVHDPTTDTLTDDVGVVWQQDGT